MMAAAFVMGWGLGAFFRLGNGDMARSERDFVVLHIRAAP
jgi:hypothetical protein